MESRKAKIVTVVYTTVKDVHEHFKSIYVKGIGGDAEFDLRHEGWFVQFDGSNESIYFGDECPKLSIGDKIKITFERITDSANPIPTPIK